MFRSRGIRIKGVTYKSAASVIIFNPPAMSKSGRKAVGKWLREQADFLEKHADDLIDSKRGFVARYWYKAARAQTTRD